MQQNLLEKQSTPAENKKKYRKEKKDVKKGSS